MITIQILQDSFIRAVSISGADALLLDQRGSVVASSGEAFSVDEKQFGMFMRSIENVGVFGGVCCGKIFNNGKPEYVCAVRTSAENAELTVRFVVLHLESLISAYKEELDKDSFIKNLLKDNLLQIDILNRAKKLGIEYKLPRTAYVIIGDAPGSDICALIRKKLDEGSEDFVTDLDSDNVVMIHRIINIDEAAGELKSVASQLMKILSDEGINAVITYGSRVEDLKDVSRSYKEARLALDVRNIFYENEDIVCYTTLGIGRLIYQLPINLCRVFINEILGGRTLDEFDEEMLTTINKFFENNLNVSETSRQLFIHRNTLVYRLDKLQKTTGLDLRVFDDAITFKIALMVVKYIDYMDRLNY